MENRLPCGRHHRGRPGMVELRWPMRTLKVKFPRTLCDPGQLRDRGGGVVPVDIEADALCICPCDRDGWRKRFEEALYTFSVPGQSCRSSFMRPVIETEWCIARVIEVQRVSDVGVWHTKTHRRQLSVDQNGVEYDCIDRGCS